MERIAIGVSRPYDVLTGKGLLSRAGQEISKIHPCQRIAVISDEHVDPLWGQGLRESLLQAGFQVFVHVIPAGDENKSPDTLVGALRFLADAQITREDLVCALGGGMVCDLAGFAAGIFLRGIGSVLIPTSLLCMTDACVGGKTAVNLPEGKNLCGVFHQPELVLCDTDLLSTLPGEEIINGMAEAAKHMLLTDWRMLLNPPRDFCAMPDEEKERFIAWNIRVKRDFVLADEQDTGKRQLLNLGHTIGHAAEKLSGYALRHGEAVAIGLAAEIIGAVKTGESDLALSDALQIKKHLSGLLLPVSCDFSPLKIFQTALSDKKRRGDRLTLPVLTKGGAVLRSLSLEQIQKLIQAGIDA